MSTLTPSLGEIKKPWKWIAAGGAILLIWGAVAFPRLAYVRPETQRAMRAEPGTEFYAAPPSAAHSVAVLRDSVDMKAGAIATPATPSVPAGRKIIRTSSMEMVVQHPADVADKI